MDDQQIVALGCLARAVIRGCAMLSENQERIRKGQAIAYTEEAFDKMIVEESASWNQVMEMIRR